MRGVKVATNLKEHTVNYGGTFEDRLHTLVNWVDPEATKKRGTVEGRGESSCMHMCMTLSMVVLA